MLYIKNLFISNIELLIKLSYNYVRTFNIYLLEESSITVSFFEMLEEFLQTLMPSLSSSSSPTIKRTDTYFANICSTKQLSNLDLDLRLCLGT